VAKQKPPDESSGRRKGTGRTTAPVQVDKELARMAAVIAAHRGVTVGEVVGPVLKPYLLTQYRLTQEQIRKELDQQTG
jgi:hypothetical protein